MFFAYILAFALHFVGGNTSQLLTGPSFQSGSIFHSTRAADGGSLPGSTVSDGGSLPGATVADGGSLPGATLSDGGSLPGQ